MPQVNNAPAKDSMEGIVAQNAALQLLISLPLSDAIGAACSFLLHCSFNHREVFRRVMNERVIREGFSGMSLLEQFKRASK